MRETPDAYAALAELEQAEAHYRLTFQVAPSADHLDVGRAWDRMKRAGDAARAALAQRAEPEPLSDERIRDLVKECGLDWHRGFVPLFDGDETNRYAVFARAIERALKGTP